MKTLIIYDSVFGNTEKIANAIGSAQSLQKDVTVKRVSEIEMKDLNDIDFLLIGSPTRGFRPTEDIAAFLKKMPSEIMRGVHTAVFDTRIPSELIKPAFFRAIVKKGGYAAPVIAKELEAKGAKLIADPQGFFVINSEGPLQEGELERAAAWANTLKI